MFATSVNPGLVRALDRVGQNLFGAAVFQVAWPPQPIRPNDPPPTEPVRLFFADNSLIPVAFNVFWPPDPIIPNDTCHSYVQVSVSQTDGVVVKYDPRFTPGDSIVLQEADLSAEQPSTAQCPAPTLNP